MSKSVSNINCVPIGWAGLAFLFFTPYAATFFVGDDWLWLTQAIRLQDELSVLTQRNIYGYFRPLALAMLSIWERLAGTHTILYSGISLFSHAVNVWLLYKVVYTYGSTKYLAGLTSFLFAFYYLNAPAVTWISSTPDLIVTTLSLLFLLQARRYCEKGDMATFILLTIIGLASVLTKESGLVCLGLFFIAVFLTKENGIRKKEIFHGTVLITIFGVYLIYYFASRTVVDKEIIFNWAVVVNLWYFMAYTLFPLSKRVMVMIPESYHWLLVVGRLLSVAAVPILSVFAWFWGGRSVRLFLIWSIGFISAISFFNWDVSLVSLYPARTASRYMYTANAGISVLLAWALIEIWKRWLSRKHGARFIVILLGVIYLVGNFGIVSKITQKYRHDQSEERVMYETVVSTVEAIKAQRLVVYVPNLNEVRQTLSDPSFIEGMLLVGTGRAVEVVITSSRNCDSLLEKSSNDAFLLWDNAIGRLVTIDPII